MNLNDFVSRASGVPFMEGGGDFSGWYCFGMIRRAYLECFGIELPDLQDCYGMTRKQGEDRFREFQVSYQQVEGGREQPGDVVYLRGQPSHMGLIVRKGYMLHVDRDLGTMIESYLTNPWRERVIGIFRHSKLAGGH